MSSEFADLARYREQLKNFCKLHALSVLAFKSGPSFKLNIERPDLDNQLHHLTSTSTCIESLLDCPSEFIPKKLKLDNQLGPEFARLAIQRPPGRWISEGSAKIYCRCRALPLVIRYLADYDKLLESHLETILYQLSKSNRFAIGEADPDAADEEDWYPPNAYHTYWFLTIVGMLKERNWQSKLKSSLKLSLGRLEDQMLLWARSIAGRQIALHVVDSSTLDSDQLAWSLAILTRFGSDFQSNLSDQDFLREGFSALFAQQTPAGTWHHGRPLFHYKEAGNAYCYIYETFAVLLKTVLERKNEGEFLRATLEPYLKKLIDLWKYALTTQIPLSVHNTSRLEEKTIGWSSGHRLEHRYAESWATASVFSYAQALRRLIGVWTREKALTNLNQIRTFSSTEDADKSIVERGATWRLSNSRTIGVAEELTTLFVNPTRRVGSHESMEPDTQAIGERQARSAILFGPPGTSKTRLARSVAGAIGWRYVELHASHFVAEGLPLVQRTANEIFERLMELDHAVILFDEIDELVRERDVEPDAFGRFLTTSMLPKLAELWEQRRVIYFIATNHIEYFDRAVTRAQRFDALVFVAPPAFGRKIAELERLIKKERPGLVITTTVEESDVNAALDALECFSSYTPDALLRQENLLAKFILLRWDQLEELAAKITDDLPSSATHLDLTVEAITNALGMISDPSLQAQKTYCDFVRAARYSMKDFGKEIVWEVINLPSGTVQPVLDERNGRIWLVTRNPNAVTLDQYTLTIIDGGKVSVTKKPKATNRVRAKAGSEKNKNKRKSR